MPRLIPRHPVLWCVCLSLLVVAGILFTRVLRCHGPACSSGHVIFRAKHAWCRRDALLALMHTYSAESQVLHSGRSVDGQWTVQWTVKNRGFSTVDGKSEWQGYVGYLPTQI